jgi:putative ubiquitin-RnfH superfamily antitoxin RatB of RatAB toxin-antitoxin module
MAELFINVSVAYALPDRQYLIDVQVAPGTTLEAAIRQSGFLRQMSDIDLANVRIGIFGKLKTLETIVRERDRIEIYRPLIADPKEARRTRAATKNAAL